MQPVNFKSVMFLLLNRIVMAFKLVECLGASKSYHGWQLSVK